MNFGRSCACFPGTVTEGVEFGEFVGVDDCAEVVSKLTNAKVVSEFVCDSIENISDDDQLEDIEEPLTLVEALAAVNLTVLYGH